MAVTLAEMLVFAADYAEATIGNARALAEALDVARFVRRAIVDREDPGQVGRDVEDLSSRFTQVCYCL